MPLLNNEPRCTGQQCPSAANCRRYTERILPKGVMAPYSAFYLRREAGDSACDGFIPVEPVSTFDAQHATARIIHANAPHEGPGAALSRTVPLDAVVGRRR